MGLGLPYVRVSPDTSSFWPLSGRSGGFSKIGGLSGFLAQSASRPTFERYQLQRRTTAWDKESSLVMSTQSSSSLTVPESQDEAGD